MVIFKYNKSEHKDAMVYLLKLRELGSFLIESLPKRGWIAFKDGDPVGAIFLRSGEGFGMIDSLITNPSFSSEDRHIAIEFLMNKLIKQAKQMKFTKLIALSSDKSAIMRSERYHFFLLPHRLMVSELSDGGV